MTDSPFPADAVLAADLVHVVYLNLADLGDEPDVVARLDDDERERAARFRFSRDRRRFVAAHALLRLVLGGFLGTRPDGIRFASGAQGKPRVANARVDVRFSLSHSEDVGAVAVSLGREVGIDVERERPPEEVRFASRLFSARERRALAALPERARTRGFFQCWTRKESFVKALGAGLAFPLQEFTVSLEDRAPQLLLECPAAPAELDRWTIIGLPADAGAAAALTVEGRGWTIRTWRGTWRSRAGHAGLTLRAGPSDAGEDAGSAPPTGP